ncbi:YcnI family protein [Streptomyces canus]|uniref:DUF1775 domain-containing protein n=1 Tax=Streptomyces canus TaxID=58343 RepID=UPI0030E39127
MSLITLSRLCVAAIGAATAVVLTAVPAAAHTEVEADKAQALAENVTVSFHAEAESDTSGIKEVRVVLPEGIAPADVVYGEGPKGWKFSATDDGYTVKGAELKTGKSAEYSVVVRQLPDAEEVPFKTLQTYGDGHVDRWIELDENGENPAPTLKLKAAAPGAKPAGPSPSASASPSPTPEETTPAASPQAADTGKDDEGGLSAGAWTGIGAGVLVAAAAVVFAVRRRGGAEE